MGCTPWASVGWSGRDPAPHRGVQGGPGGRGLCGGTHWRTGLPRSRRHRRRNTPLPGTGHARTARCTALPGWGAGDVHGCQPQQEHPPGASLCSLASLSWGEELGKESSRDPQLPSLHPPRAYGPDPASLTVGAQWMPTGRGHAVRGHSPDARPGSRCPHLDSICPCSRGGSGSGRC